MNEDAKLQLPNITRDDLRLILGDPLISVPFGDAFHRERESLTFCYWLCEATEVQRAQALAMVEKAWPRRSHESEIIDEQSFRELATHLEAISENRSACSAAYDGRTGVWYVFERCHQHSS